MNKKTKSIVIFILTILSSISVRAQNYPDYIITVKGDSIPCRITSPSKYGKKEYQDSTMATPEKITSERVRDFYQSENHQLWHAVYENDDKSSTFLSYVEKGRISIYAHVPFNLSIISTSTRVDWYIGKGADDHVHDFKSNGMYITKTRNEREDDFAPLLKDNPQVYNKFMTERDFSFEGIQKIVHLYNTGEAYDGTSDGTAPVSGRNYIVTQKNDTVFCRIKNDYFTGKYMYNAAKDDNYIPIDSTNTKEFFYARDTSHFALINVPGLPNRVFLKQLEKGKVNLYQQTVISNDRDRKELQSFWYINKGGGPLLLIGNKANRVRKFEIKNAQLKIFFDVIADNADLLTSCKKALDTSASNKNETIRYFIQNYNFLYLASHESGKQ